MALLGDVARITADRAGRAEVNLLIKRLRLWIGLKFRPEVKGARRVVKRRVSGRMVFEGPLWVTLFSQDNVVGEQQGGGCPSPLHVASAEENAHDKEKPSVGESAGAMVAMGGIECDSWEEKQTAGGWSPRRRLSWLTEHPTG